jgi:hypothetical protein
MIGRGIIGDGMDRGGVWGGDLYRPSSFMLEGAGLGWFFATGLGWFFATGLTGSYADALGLGSIYDEVGRRGVEGGGVTYGGSS